MGESSLLLAEASVGKNAEKVSHELGAREPCISTAAACVGGKEWRVALRGAPHAPVLTRQLSDNKLHKTNSSGGLNCQAYILYILQWLQVIFLVFYRFLFSLRSQ